MQGRDEKTWAEVIEDTVKLVEKIERLEQENKSLQDDIQKLLKRLGESETERFYN